MGITPMTKILTCNCKHAGQDKLHGSAKRVFNQTTSGNPTQETWRCTVCEKEVTLGKKQ